MHLHIPIKLHIAPMGFQNTLCHMYFIFSFAFLSSHQPCITYMHSLAIYPYLRSSIFQVSLLRMYTLFLASHLASGFAYHICFGHFLMHGYGGLEMWRFLMYILLVGCMRHCFGLDFFSFSCIFVKLWCRFGWIAVFKCTFMIHWSLVRKACLYMTGLLWTFKLRCLLESCSYSCA